MHTGKKWDLKTEVRGSTFAALDFSGTNFNRAVFFTVRFNDCLFNRSNLKGVKCFTCNFENCEFDRIDLRQTIFAQGGLFKNCVFKKCNFQGVSFNSPHFAGCMFDNCKFKKNDFNDASFESCTFIGTLEDVTFNGMYHEVKTGYKPLEKVDFSEAVFGEFVGFDNCDLSTCIPPKGKTFEELLYVVDLNQLCAWHAVCPGFCLYYLYQRTYLFRF